MMLLLVQLGFAAPERTDLYRGCTVPETFGGEMFLCRTIAAGFVPALRGDSPEAALAPMLLALQNQQGLRVVSASVQTVNLARTLADGSDDLQGWVRWQGTGPSAYAAALCIAPVALSGGSARCDQILSDLHRDGAPTWLPPASWPALLGRPVPVPADCTGVGDAYTGLITCEKDRSVLAFQQLPTLPSPAAIGDVCGPLVRDWVGATYTANPAACTLEGEPVSGCGVCSVQPISGEPFYLTAAVGLLEGSPVLVSCASPTAKLAEVCKGTLEVKRSR